MPAKLLWANLVGRRRRQAWWVVLSLGGSLPHAAASASLAENAAMLPD